MAFLKHRDEKEVFAMDFALRLATGETLSNPGAKVTLKSGATYTDKSSEFIVGSPTVSGSKVQVTMKAAVSAPDQAVGVDYVVYAKADTSQGRILVATTPLTVTAEAST
jgi:hypothetical protein